MSNHKVFIYGIEYLNQDSTLINAGVKMFGYTSGGWSMQHTLDFSFSTTDSLLNIKSNLLLAVSNRCVLWGWDVGSGQMLNLLGGF